MNHDLSLFLQSRLRRSIMNLFLLLVHSLLFTTTLVSANSSSQWIDYPANGFASMTHYTLPLNFVASCGCVPGSTHYPTAALSQMAYGSSTAYGPSCGRCFKLTLLNTFLSNPPFFPDESKSVVVKVTDLCPIAGQWCSATRSKPNPYVLWHFRISSQMTWHTLSAKFGQFSQLWPRVAFTKYSERFLS